MDVMEKFGLETVMAMILAHQKTKNRTSDYLHASGGVEPIP